MRSTCGTGNVVCSPPDFQPHSRRPFHQMSMPMKEKKILRASDRILQGPPGFVEAVTRSFERRSAGMGIRRAKRSGCRTLVSSL